MKSSSIVVPNPSPPELLFVYGTLKSSYWNNHHLDYARAIKIGDGETVCRFPLVAVRLPMLLPFPGVGHRVQGELYQLPAWGLRRVDQLEGHPNWYKRTKISILHEGELYEAWVYFMTKRFVPGNWESFELLSSF